jgi:hypothetical protein
VGYVVRCRRREQGGKTYRINSAACVNDEQVLCHTELNPAGKEAASRIILILHYKK